MAAQQFYCCFSRQIFLLITIAKKVLRCGDMVSLGRLDYDPVIVSSSDLVTSNVTDQVASEQSTPISEVLDTEKHLAL